MDTQNFIAATLTDAELIELIEYHNRRYWEEQKEIPDHRYDELTRELNRRLPGHPLLVKIYTPKVAAIGKVVHRQPMLSLDKAYSLAEVLTWAAKYARTPDEPLLVQPKYDGVSAAFDGQVLATRGDGEVGENISDKIPLIRLETAGYCGVLDRPVRGEILLRDDHFKSLCRQFKNRNYKNSRNILTGLLTLVNNENGNFIDQAALGMKNAGAYLSLVDYDLISHQIGLDELEKRWPELVEEMEQLPYPLDGIVVKFADPELSRTLGNTAHHPRGEIAFKFSNIRRETTLLDVEWSFGKNCLTPVAQLAPVDINGITIKRATLHNVQNIIDLDLQIGDTVTVERAGDVIPHIVASAPGETRRSALIDRCPDPACGAPLVRRGPELVCPNPDCPGTRLQRLAAAVRCLAIENLGEPTLRQMMRHLGVKTLHDIFNVSAADLARLDGFGDKKPKIVHDSIKAARQVHDFQLLAALNIPNIGINIAKDLLQKYPLAELRRMSAEALQDIHGMGPERAAGLRRAFDEQADFLDELLAEVSIVESSGAADRPGVCFTGKMPEKREYYGKVARHHGFEERDDVTAGLAMLVAADPAAAGGKLDKAHKLNVPIIGLTDWLAQYPPPAAVAKTAEADGEQQLAFDF
jgi:DNA ligase (NAD+)